MSNIRLVDVADLIYMVRSGTNRVITDRDLESWIAKRYTKRTGIPARPSIHGIEDIPVRDIDPVSFIPEELYHLKSGCEVIFRIINKGILIVIIENE